MSIRVARARPQTRIVDVETWQLGGKALSDLLVPPELTFIPLLHLDLRRPVSDQLVRKRRVNGSDRRRRRCSRPVARNGDRELAALRT